MPNQEAAEGAGTEGGRRPSVVPAPSAANPEISDRPRRRTFTAPKKLRILKEVDEAAGTGEIGAILRRHGLYSSALCEWRRQREAGTLGGLTPVNRGPKPAETNPLSAKLAASDRENAQLRRRLDLNRGHRLEIFLGPGLLRYIHSATRHRIASKRKAL
jgi:transposase-like protein